MSIHVHLERFEGPLGLLLHLIREQEMDIFNINIHQITRQYLEYIKTMRRLDLEVAGEFIAMAATLLHIKSRMLLPQYTEEGEAIQEDPRKELVQKLLEYKKIKELSGELYKQPLLFRDVYPRGRREDIESAEEGELVLEEKPLFSLIAAYRTALKNMKKTIHRVLGEVQSISARILEIKDYLIVGKRLVFNDLITDQSRQAGQVLVTFLALLELAKMGFVSLFQSAPFADLHVETKRPVDRDVITQVESYDSVNAEQKAAEIFNEAQLSLDEGDIESEDVVEVGEKVVEETFADAATDDEIFQEEQRLFGEPESVAVGAMTGEEVVAIVDQIVGESPVETAAAQPEVEIATDEQLLDQVNEAVVAALESIPETSDEASTDAAVETTDTEWPSITAELAELEESLTTEEMSAEPEEAPAPAAPQKESVASLASKAAADLAFLTAPDVPSKPEPEPGASDV